MWTGISCGCRRDGSRSWMESSSSGPLGIADTFRPFCIHTCGAGMALLTAQMRSAHGLQVASPRMPREITLNPQGVVNNRPEGREPIPSP
ncbi:hypothetical protein PanWU01x14_087980 [Parasponia andersonii]|uniref:Uncharacterized protein n=1 Tax=Parasponia andersonii TaxID=3476 RepID=A0A2P5D7T6_PARAD|nr:hypothetical protein PanWU01x14_087980 [Parasponia andersonii]